MHILIQLQAHPNQVQHMRHWCLHEWGPSLAQAASLQKVIVNLALTEIQLLPYGQSESLQGEALDVVVQLWPHLQCNVANLLQSLQQVLQEKAAKMHIYQISDTEVLNRQELDSSTVQVPGIKIMRGLFLYEDLPDTAAKRMWAHHSNLASKVHVGLSRYARHWVDQVITEYSPKIRGLSDLHFPDLESIQNRYFDSERGREEISHDIGHFIQDGTVRFFGEEYILKNEISMHG
jgi:hypothetical protein